MNTFNRLLLRCTRLWFFFTIVTIPFSLTYITVHPFALSYLNVISVIFILLTSACLATGCIHYKPVNDRSLIVLCGLLFLVIVYAIPFTHPLRNWVGFGVSRLGQPFLVGFASYQLLANKVIKVEEIIKALFYSLIPLCIGGLLQLVDILPHRDPTRITVLYSFANTFARYVDILLTLSLFWLLFSGSKATYLRISLWVAGGFLLLTTISYNGVVSLVLAFGITFLLLPKQFRRAQYWLYSIGIAVTLLVASQVQHLPKWHMSINDSRVTRLEFWKVATMSIKDHFWTGIGIKGWETQYPQLVVKYAHGPILSRVSMQPHNVFLDSFLKAGLPGFIIITALLIWPIVKGYQLFRRAPTLQNGGWFGLSIFTYGVAMLLFGIIDDPIWSDDTIPLLFILYFAVSYELCRIQKKEKA